jgi:hypothetical protein
VSKENTGSSRSEYLDFPFSRSLALMISDHVRLPPSLELAV